MKERLKFAVGLISILAFSAIAAAQSIQQSAKTEAEKVKATDALKLECGADFQHIEAGMSIDRAKHCVAPFQLVSQIHSLYGDTVSKYQACTGDSCLRATVVREHIVAWSQD